MRTKQEYLDIDCYRNNLDLENIFLGTPTSRIRPVSTFVLFFLFPDRPLRRHGFVTETKSQLPSELQLFLSSSHHRTAIHRIPSPQHTGNPYSLLVVHDYLHSIPSTRFI